MDDLRTMPIAPNTANTGTSRSRPLVLINHLVEPPGRITGITRYALGLIEALVQRGNTRIILATSFKHDELPMTIARGVEQLVTIPHVASTPVSFLRQARLLRALCKTHKPDVVYAMNPMCPSISGIPSIVTVHDLYMEVMPELYARRHRLWWRLFFPHAARTSARVVCVSNNSAADITRLHPRISGKIAIVPGAGVLPQAAGDSASTRPPGLPTGPYLLALGNVTPNKNLGFLAAALQHLRVRGEHVNVVHVGRDMCGDLRNAIAQSSGQLVSIGGIDDAQLDYVMRNAGALVQPSRYEGFGLPIIEAHDRGVPVIASDIAIFREVGGEGCAFVPLDDSQALAAQMLSATNSPQWRDEYSRRARMNATRFGWAQSAAAAESMIHEVIAG